MAGPVEEKSNGLSGFWTGSYWYLGAAGAMAASTPFNAYIDDDLGTLTGTTLEPNTFADPSLDELSATLSGARAELSVAFRKIYDPVPGVHRMPVHYSGDTNPEFTVIEGEWRFRIPFQPFGGFRLIRASSAKESIAVAETIKIG